MAEQPAIGRGQQAVAFRHREEIRRQHVALRPPHADQDLVELTRGVLQADDLLVVQAQAVLGERLANEVEQVRYFKIETAGAASKLRELIRLGGDKIQGPWDGEEAITLLPDLDAGATGSMTGGGFPDGLRPILDAYREGRREEAIDRYMRWLPLINIENRQCGFLAAKALMKEGGIIDCDAPRHPWPAMQPETRAMLLEAAKRLDVLALRWAR
jgi:4-hydroxy-tetrahydrodipicolinate synthase/2-keto-3-deoxy-L-arabinonate dehydratase